MASRNDLKNWFKDYAKPTGAQFANLIDSFYHKVEDMIPIAKIQNLAETLAGKADAIATNLELQELADLLALKADADDLATKADKGQVNEFTEFNNFKDVGARTLTLSSYGPDAVAGDVSAGNMYVSSNIVDRFIGLRTYRGKVASWRIGEKSNGDLTAAYWNDVSKTWVEAYSINKSTGVVTFAFSTFATANDVTNAVNAEAATRAAADTALQIKNNKLFINLYQSSL